MEIIDEILHEAATIERYLDDGIEPKLGEIHNHRLGWVVASFQGVDFNSYAFVDHRDKSKFASFKNVLASTNGISFDSITEHVDVAVMVQTPTDSDVVTGIRVYCIPRYRAIYETYRNLGNITYWSQ